MPEKPVPHTLWHRELVWFEAGEGEREIHLVPARSDEVSTGPMHICFQVEDVEVYRERLADAGCEIVEAQPIPNRPRFFSRDPFGNRLEITGILGPYFES